MTGITRFVCELCSVHDVAGGVPLPKHRPILPSLGWSLTQTLGTSLSLNSRRKQPWLRQFVVTPFQSNQWERREWGLLSALSGVSPHTPQQHRSSSAHVSVSSRCYPRTGDSRIIVRRRLYKPRLRETLQIQIGTRIGLSDKDDAFTAL